MRFVETLYHALFLLMCKHFLRFWTKEKETNPNTKNEPQHDKINKIICAPSEDSDQPGHPPSQIRVFVVRMKKHWVLIYLLSALRRLWSHWADAQTDLGLRWAHRSVCWFCHEAAQIKTQSSQSMKIRNELNLHQIKERVEAKITENKSSCYTQDHFKNRYVFCMGSNKKDILWLYNKVTPFLESRIPSVEAKLIVDVNRKLEHYTDS